MRSVVAAAIGLVSIAAATVVLAEPPAGAAACSGCHPSAGRGPSPVARLAGRDRAEIVKAMQDFRSGARTGTVMDRIAKGFTEAETRAIAAWLSQQK